MVGFPTTIGFPTKNDHFRVFWGYHHLRKPPILRLGPNMFSLFFSVVIHLPRKPAEKKLAPKSLARRFHSLPQVSNENNTYCLGMFRVYNRRLYYRVIWGI